MNIIKPGYMVWFCQECGDVVGGRVIETDGSHVYQYEMQTRGYISDEGLCGAKCRQDYMDSLVRKNPAMALA